jgi:hypothetical protein
MNIVTNILISNEFQLIKRDIRAVKQYILQDDINNWKKILIVYTFYLFFNHLSILYQLTCHYNSSCNIRYIYLYFFILCNIRNSYLYFIHYVSKIDLLLAESLFENTKKYFI